VSVGPLQLYDIQDQRRTGRLDEGLFFKTIICKI
jgi:hypothetical protein